MTCPKCGHAGPEGAAECARCGVIFRKIAGNSIPPRRTFPPPVIPGISGGPGREHPPWAGPAGTLPPKATASLASLHQGNGPLLDEGGRRALLIGGALALACVLVPFPRFIFGHLTILLHEFGHFAANWIFGYPSIPAFDFLHGGGVTIHQSRHPGVMVLIYAALGLGIFHLRASRAAMAALAAITAAYSLAAFTSIHEVLRLFMGHGSELIFAGIFLHRAISGERIQIRAERPAYAFAGAFILLHDIHFASGLLLNQERRVEYELAKGGGSWMDFSQIAEIYLGTELKNVAGLFLFCCALPPLLCLIVHRRRAA